MRSWTDSDVIKPLLEPILEPVLHPSQWRIRALCLSIALGHPLFYWVWTAWLPQPYESLWQRLGVSLLGTGLLLFPRFTAPPPSRVASAVITAIFWLTVPVYFTWMYLCNERNAVWLATLAAMFLIYYHVTDWRIATIGTASGLLTGWALFAAFGPQTREIGADEFATHLVVFGFSWYMALMLGLSASNLRREQLKQALGTMGIMAHELRTPLATMSLIGDAVRNEANAPSASPATLMQLSTRLHALARNMNRQVDMQIANAQLMHLPAQHEIVSAGSLVLGAAAGFPYRNERERECVTVQVIRDFQFRTSEALFTQVIDNLVKNALRSLASTPTARRRGDLRIEVDVAAGRGLITVSDRGLGMDERLKSRLFQLFVSTSQGTGHGLGLAFCQRVVQYARGSIRVESAPLHGASFIIELPLAASIPVPQPLFERITP